ncbi:MAG: peptidyl-prolyl cis-trans isomerase [Deltaproteobacteria bacterium]|nr:peptidyl-prolyl cis-trans isomerase [Deltaproteobacteria bacterium]
MTSRTRATRLAGVVLGATLLGCAPPAGPQDDTLPDSPSKADPRVVVARVNGRPILLEDLASQRRNGQSAREALRALIREELLAQEARRRGLDTHAGVRDAQRRALAQHLIRRELANFSTKTVPRALVERAYELNRSRYQRPELAEVVHIVAEARRKDPPEAHRRARELAEKARTVATSGRLSPEEFSQIAPLLQKNAGGIKVHAEALATARRGQTVESFAEAAFALEGQGSISPVVATRYGYHVIYLKGRVPAVDIPLSQAESEIRARVFEEARRMAFAQFTEQLEKRTTPRIDEAVLARALSPAQAR